MAEKVERRLFLTGASGLLGRSIHRTFREAGWTVLGLSFSRTGPDLQKLDLTDFGAVVTAITKFKPTLIIHSAAQRFPDKVSSDPDGARRINVDATFNLAETADKYDIPLLYISTDYVFDGRNPPFKIEDKPHPLNDYGKLKLEGEEIVMAASKENIILRVPVLYGPVEKLSESAVTCLLEPLLNVAKPTKVSDYEKRCPSHVDDIAEICLNLAVFRFEHKDLDVCGIFQWCGSEILTKYQMVQVMGEVFSLPHVHISKAPDPSNGTAQSVSRPYDTQMDRTRLESKGIGRHTPFASGIKSALAAWVS
ncbi:Methionine adenosyltransferase 2 subunit beta [Frankliniella fusca]|uniref:Methionine adenosyltransferase 2 subunit beta n=1 Tax=Frankliniella fusca TaxID=407009 RepID=A0AAE1HDP0_9NEOP|nr:Methionine adenosyltransferase 2 subunit beta [Frankliniella fusca]